MQMWVQSPSQEDILEKEIATNFTTMATIQYSCLGNPRDKGAWQAAVHGVAKVSDTT